MIAINLEPNIDRPDDLYAEIIEMTAGQSDVQAFALQARLILLLANQIGDVSIITQFVRLAAQNGEHDLIDSENP